MKTHDFFNKAAMLYLQNTLHVTRKELVATIKLTCISADSIAEYVKQRKPLFHTLAA